MPANPRVRNDNVFGTLTDNPLTNVATTMNSAGLANLEAVATEHAIIVIDPLRSAGAPETVIVTAHTGSATSATISRGAYGTAARQHAAGVLWVHAPTIEDFIRIVAATADITDPYEGQLCYEHDTDIYHGYNGSGWVSAVPLGAWTTWSPTLANLTLGSGSVVATYARVGRIIRFRFQFTFGAGSAVGTNPTFTLPVAGNAAYDDYMPIGMAAYYDDNAGTLYTGMAHVNADDETVCITFRIGGSGSAGVAVTATAPFTWTTPDSLSVTGAYEAAS